MAKKSKKTTDTPTAENVPAKTIGDMATGFLAHMKEKGSTDATVASYAADLDILLKKFGTGMLAEYMMADVVSAYYDCDEVTKKKNGKPRHKITVAKIRRVFRMAVEWAVGQGWIDPVEFPKPVKVSATPEPATEPAPQPAAATADEAPTLPTFNHPEVTRDEPAAENPERAPKKKGGKKAKVLVAAE